MISYRPFLNSDVPHIVAIWKNRGHDPALTREISADLFDRLVLSKLYFDRHGLIMALERDAIVGFVHAGFGPNADESQLDNSRGVVSLLLTRADCNDAQIADGLLKQAENYLAARGAQSIAGIGVGALCPFYLGLYGGCDLPGVFDSDQERTEFFKRNGYRPQDRIACYRKEITAFRPSLNRLTIRLRRSQQIEFVSDPAARSWWDACTQGCLPQLLAVTRSLGAKETFAKALFWDMQTLTGPAAERTMGLSRIEISDPTAPPGTAEYLLEECFHYLQQQGIQHVLGQCAEEDRACAKILEGTGMQRYDTGTLWSKSTG